MRFWKEILVLCIGGVLYCIIELLWRGRTHLSMFLLGGSCFWLIGSFNRVGNLSVLTQMLLGTVTIVALEFAVGVMFNRRLEIWNYSDLPLNLMGQICLPYALLWFPLSAAAIFAEDAVRHALFSQCVPQYRWI